MNSTAKGILNFGWILIVLGVIVGIYYGVSQNTVVGLYLALSAAIIGTLFIGLSEIIHLLQKLIDKDSIKSSKIEIQNSLE